MRFIGSKKTVFKYIKPFLHQHVPYVDVYYEPFVGGCNSLLQFNYHGVKRVGWDYNRYLIAMWQKLQDGWLPRKDIDRELYYDIKNNPDSYDDHMVGYVSFLWSFKGGLFHGYVDITGTNAVNLLVSEGKKLRDVLFQNFDFFKAWEYIRDGSLVYIDPPYKQGGEYYGSDVPPIDYDVYRELSKKCYVYISEYPDTIPYDFVKLMERSVTKRNFGVPYTRQECLYTYGEGLAWFSQGLLAKFQSEALI